MKKNILMLSAAVVMALSVFSGCDKNRYAEINTDPATVGEGNVPFLFTQAYLSFEPSSYLYWFYISKITKRMAQVNGGSQSDTFNNMGELGGIGSQFVAVKRYELEIRDILSRMDKEEADKYANVSAITNVLTAYLAVLDSDLFGSMPYSEACLARYGGTLTPKYDTQEELFNTLLNELDADIAVLSHPEGQVSLNSQDPMYGGDFNKWLKVANGVKLKIAVRLLHQNKAKALQIAQEVAASGQIMTVGESFIYNKGRSKGPNSDMWDYAYHFGDGVGGMGTANKTIIDFMKANQDPRMLVMYTKNEFNSEIVQLFFDAEAEQRAAGVSEDRIPAIPSYVLEEIDYTVDASGKKTFVGWKGLGEPWVRYHGVPLGINISNDPAYRLENNYFNSDRWLIETAAGTKSYSPYSGLTERLVRGRLGNFVFPTVPGDVSQIAYTSLYPDNGAIPWWGMGLTAGEVNLYLAELSLAGASLPKTAAAYFEAGVRASAEEYMIYASKNDIPYIDESKCYTKDKLDAPTGYGAAEIDAMMANPAYQLTGNHTDDLEKVYIQQYLHFMYQPVEQFVSARRGGVPKIGSAYLPWNKEFDPNVVPRRLYISQPTDTDVMKDIKIAAYAEEGFTCTDGNQPATLNKERVWYDKGAPQWGAGPNL